MIYTGRINLKKETKIFLEENNLGFKMRAGSLDRKVHF
jgi:hypothetical protein